MGTKTNDHPTASTCDGVTLAAASQFKIIIPFDALLRRAFSPRRANVTASRLLLHLNSRSSSLSTPRFAERFLLGGQA